MENVDNIQCDISRICAEEGLRSTVVTDTLVIHNLFEFRLLEDDDVLQVISSSAANTVN